MKGKSTNPTETEENTLNQNSAGEADNASKFSKEQLIKSNCYSHGRDVLTALLEDDKMYTHGDIDQIIKDFSERKVK